MDLADVGNLLHLHVAGLNRFEIAIKTILSQLCCSPRSVITQPLFQFQKLDCSGDLCQHYTRPATTFCSPTVFTDSLFSFILNNCHR